MAFNLDKASSVGKTRKNTTDRLADICEAVINHPNLSAVQIGAGLDLPNGAYVPVGVIRQVLRTLAAMDAPVTHEGKQYRFSPVVAAPALVKADEKKSA